MGKLAAAGIHVSKLVSFCQMHCPPLQLDAVLHPDMPCNECKT